MPGQAIIYVRISDSRIEDQDGQRQRSTAGTADQERRCRDKAGQLGWTVGPASTHVIVEQDTSAFKRRRIVLPGGRTELRVVRPGFRRGLDMLADGRADGMIALDLDRAMRDPRDLEDLIDVVEQSVPRVLVTSVTGSLSGLTTDGEIFLARIVVAHANQSSRDTSRRVSAARQRQAAAGSFGGGRRPFGWERDGMTLRPAEAAVIGDAARMLLAGVSLREIAAGLRGRGAPLTDSAPQWDAKLVRQVLLRPRNAGIAVWKGEEAGPARWDAALDEATWRAVAAVLADPARRTNMAGPAPRWLLSLIARCGVCGDVVVQGGGYGQYPRYRCRARNGHVSRAARPADELVSRAMVARLRLPDAASQITYTGAGAVGELVQAAGAARERMTALSGMFGAGELTVAAFRAGYDAAGAELARIERLIEASAPGDVLAGIAGRDDAAELWELAELGRRRAIVRALAEVTFLPGGKGGRQPDGSYFNPRSVLVEWRPAGARSLRAVRGGGPAGRV